MCRRAWSCALFFLLAIANQSAHAANLNVNCDNQQTIREALHLLAATNPQGPNTITVLGSCKENVVIQSMDRLTLITKKGASITDRSKAALPVIDIEDSRSVSVQGFTTNGGTTGILCSDFSICRFSGNTVQNVVYGIGMDGQGVVIVRSNATFDHDVIQDNADNGLAVINGSTVISDGLTVQRNGVDGIFVAFQSMVVVRTATVQANSGDGIFGNQNSTFNVASSLVTGNGGNGVSLAQASTAQFSVPLGPNNVMNNALSGVLLGDLSSVLFVPGNSVVGNNTGSGGMGNDVTCDPQFSATRGAITNIGGGTTNCVEPTRYAQRGAAN